MSDRPKFYRLRILDVDDQDLTATLVVNAAVIERIVDALVTRSTPGDLAGAEADGQIAHKLQAAHALITPANYTRLN